MLEKLVIIFCGILAFLEGIYIFEAQSRFPLGHIGFNPKLSYNFFLAAFLVTFLAIFRFRKERQLVKWLTFANLLVLSFWILVWIGESCNFLVEYNTWIDRGMPEAGQCAFSNG